MDNFEILAKSLIVIYRSNLFHIFFYLQLQAYIAVQQIAIDEIETVYTWFKHDTKFDEIENQLWVYLAKWRKNKLGQHLQ